VKEKTHEHEKELKKCQNIHVPDNAIIEMNEAETGVQHENVTEQTCEPNKTENSEANTAFNSRTTVYRAVTKARVSMPLTPRRKSRVI
jgi:hypothetical protein